MSKHQQADLYVISWSGGKDCFLAAVTLKQLHRLDWQDMLFVTFVPAVGDFLCHPLGILERQSRLLGVMHEFLVIDEQAWELGYRQALGYLKDTYHPRHFVTGEILLTEHSQEPYWLADILFELEMHLANPITPQPAKHMLELLSHHQITAMTTGIKERFFHPDFLGKPISWELLEHTGMTRLANFGWYGENGEYHTLVTQYQDTTFADIRDTNDSTTQKGEVIARILPDDWHLLKDHQRKRI